MNDMKWQNNEFILDATVKLIYIESVCLRKPDNLNFPHFILC